MDPGVQVFSSSSSKTPVQGVFVALAFTARPNLQLACLIQTNQSLPKLRQFQNSQAEISDTQPGPGAHRQALCLFEDCKWLFAMNMA